MTVKSPARPRAATRTIEDVRAEMEQAARYLRLVESRIDGNRSRPELRDKTGAQLMVLQAEAERRVQSLAAELAPLEEVEQATAREAARIRALNCCVELAAIEAVRHDAAAVLVEANAAHIAAQGAFNAAEFAEGRRHATSSAAMHAKIDGLIDSYPERVMDEVSRYTPAELRAEASRFRSEAKQRAAGLRDSEAGKS